jgi:hypothetical protein
MQKPIHFGTCDGFCMTSAGTGSSCVHLRGGVASSAKVSDDAVAHRWACPKIKERTTELAATCRCATTGIGVSCGPQHLRRLRNCEGTRRGRRTGCCGDLGN